MLLAEMDIPFTIVAPIVLSLVGAIVFMFMGGVAFLKKVVAENDALRADKIKLIEANGKYRGAYINAKKTNDDMFQMVAEIHTQLNSE